MCSSGVAPSCCWCVQKLTRPNIFRAVVVADAVTFFFIALHVFLSKKAAKQADRRDDAWALATFL